MPLWLNDLLVKLVPSLVVAVVTAWATVRLSLRRFRTERWWERKADAYSRIVESLYHAKQYYDHESRKWWNEQESPSRDPSKVESDEDRRRRAEFSEAFHELAKATHIGAYIICDEAAKVLDDLKKRKGLEWDEGPPGDVYDDAATGYAEALHKLRAIAKRDLGVP
jgi:hypothetical protein